MGQRKGIEEGGVVSPERAAGSPANQAARSRWHHTFVWIAFLVAFSPLLSDLVDHVRAHPWAAWSLVFAMLLAVLARRDSSHALPRRDGYALLGMALVLQGIAIGGGPMRWGRPAIPLGVFGLARILGRPSLRVAALACWAVPLPWSIVRAASPLLEYIWLRVAAATLSSFAPIFVQRASATWPNGVLSLEPSDGGLPLVAFLSGVGWIYALRTWRGLGRGLVTAAVWGLAALPVQVLAVMIALALAIGHKPDAARAWLSWGVFLVCTVLALAVTLRDLRAPRN
ncbi:MAG TPA: hypothetical protein VKM54_03105 [Myxococcota bacterium]|nr:hypothetical protein [Myxococcota bacterium]